MRNSISYEGMLICTTYPFHEHAIGVEILALKRVCQQNLRDRANTFVKMSDSHTNYTPIMCDNASVLTTSSLDITLLLPRST